MNAGVHGSTGAATDRRGNRQSRSRASRPRETDVTKGKLRRTIFALCREREIGEDLRHELQLSVTGKGSLTECTVAEMRQIVSRLSGQNVWTPQGMMKKLAGELEDGRTRLRAFCWKRFQKEPEDLDPNETRSAIAFLKNVKKQPAAETET